MRARVMALCAAATVASGCGGGGDDATTSRPAAIDVVLDTTPRHEVVTGHKVIIDASIEAGGRPVARLQADPFPFAGFSDVATKKAQLGDVHFKVRPTVNTRYRVIVTKGEATGRSSPLTVFADVVPHFQGGFKGGKFKTVVTVKLPPGARPKRGRVYFYGRWGASKRYVLMGSVQRYVATKSRLAAHITVRERAPHVRVLACVKNGWAHGVDPPNPDPGCGARTQSGR
jgi:hypothetical protein